MNTFKKSLFFLWLICTPILLIAQEQHQDGYEIDVQIDGLSQSDLYLGFHYGDRQFIKDTIRLNENGHGTFKGNKDLDQGIYLMITPAKKYFEVLIGKDQHFSVSTNVKDLVHTLRFEGSQINQAFTEYQQFMMVQTQRKNALQEKLQSNSGSDSTDIWRERLNELNRQVEDNWKTIAQNHKGSILATIIRAMKNPEVPDFNIPESADNKDSIRWTRRYRYYKDHFFDNLDLSDSRLVRTPIFHNKIDHYFNNILRQQPDSIIKQIDWVVDQTRGSEENFQYVVRYLLNHYQKSNIMGMDKVFVYVAENYYLNGDADWVDTATITRIRDRVQKIKPNLIGKQAPRLQMSSLDGEKYNLYDMNSQYTLLYFWEPSCGHCKKVTPKIYDLYEQYDRDQFQVFAVYTQGDQKEWKEYVNKNGMDWINVYDPNHSSKFRRKFDVYSTPTIYLLDKDKTIIAKRIGHETLKKMLQQKIGN